MVGLVVVALDMLLPLSAQSSSDDVYDIGWLVNMLPFKMYLCDIDANYNDASYNDISVPNPARYIILSLQRLSEELVP